MKPALCQSTTCMSVEQMCPTVQFVKQWDVAIILQLKCSATILQVSISCVAQSEEMFHLLCMQMQMSVNWAWMTAM